MKKLIVGTLSSTLLATSILTPVVSANENENNQEEQSYNTKSQETSPKTPQKAPEHFNEDEYIDSVLVSENINRNDNSQQASSDTQFRGKVGMTVKTAMKSIKKYKSQIQNTINSAIDKLPLSNQVKAHWKKVITVDALLEALGHYTDFGDNVEGAINNALTDMGLPGWMANAVAKTITFAIPVL